MENIFNFNIGVLGHVDSGKTSLAKALSSTASTACFDKNPQSKERGITLDLGFSSFVTDVPNHLQNASIKYNKIQYTLVDCPGHASLIKTIIGGAQILDLMMLVIDVTKGMQTQTVECLIIGEITCSKMIVVLNKIDLLQESKVKATVEKMKSKIESILKKMKFKETCVVAVSAKPGGPDAPPTEVPKGIEALVDSINSLTFIPERNHEAPFLFSVDHCFSIKGQGTVLTGTVLQGSVCINDTVEIPALKVSKKVKSMQMFRKPVTQAAQGDRLGICLPQFDPKLIERGIISAPGYVSTAFATIVAVKKIPQYKSAVATKSKFHISLGHETVMGKLTVFGNYSREKLDLDFNQEYRYQEELHGENTSGGETKDVPTSQYALIEFDSPVTVPMDSVVIGSKLDTDLHLNMCRLAFQGKIVHMYLEKDYRTSNNGIQNLKIYKDKVKEGTIDRANSKYEIIVKNIFKKETNLQTFSGLKVMLSSGEEGTIEGTFGQSGKIKIYIKDGLEEELYEKLSAKKKKTNKVAEETSKPIQPVKVILRFKKYIYDPDKKIIQN